MLGCKRTTSRSHDSSYYTITKQVFYKLINTSCQDGLVRRLESVFTVRPFNVSVVSFRHLLATANRFYHMGELFDLNCGTLNDEF